FGVSPLSFAYFSLRRQRKVGAAPHRGNARAARRIADASEEQSKPTHRECPRHAEIATQSQTPAIRAKKTTHHY
ncbi:hypothetical protein, partial [Paraburkholderia piptadeniae]|uniref:hypothetical protein n=1 Tax=Paraburkholderia piptadeniae TaxID=1701573 RepID=UPI001C43EEAD